MLKQYAKNWEIILASKSPRRSELIKNLGLEFKSIVKNIDENFPNDLNKNQIASYISEKKADAFDLQKNNQLLITGDTIIYSNGKVLGKPTNKKEAYAMIESFSGNIHEVISAFCIKTKDKKIIRTDCVKVHFKALESDEINYYINEFSPYDKAGAYGIQEWIGQIGITKIEGSFYTVMGMPIHLLYESLKNIMISE